MLSDRFIRNAPTGIYADGAELYLQVYPTGKKAFLLRRRVAGKQTKRVLGHYPELSLAAARDLVGKLRSGVVERTVAEAFTAYYAHLETQHRDPEQTRRPFEKDILPVLGDIQLSAIQKTDYTAILQAVVRRGAPSMANRMLVQIKRFLAWCEDQGWLSDNPLEKVARRSIGGKEHSRERMLTLAEIDDFLNLLLYGANGMAAGTRWVLVGCLLTGCRVGEVMVIGQDGNIPETKAGRPHSIPMTPHVRLWLRRRPTTLPADPRVMSHALRRLKMTFTPHDLRRTFATQLAELGVAPHVVEKLLNHQMTGVMAVYNRAKYWPDRVAAQKLWGRTLARLRKKEAADDAAP